MNILVAYSIVVTIIAVVYIVKYSKAKRYERERTVRHIIREMAKTEDGE
jgi:hypothetical protein